MPTTQPDRHLSRLEDAQASERATIHSTVVPREFDLGLPGFGGSAGELDDRMMREEGEFVRREVGRDGGGEERLECLGGLGGLGETRSGKGDISLERRMLERKGGGRGRRRDPPRTGSRSDRVG